MKLKKYLLHLKNISMLSLGIFMNLSILYQKHLQII